MRCGSRSLSIVDGAVPITTAVFVRDASFSPYSLPFERQAQLTGLTAKGGNVVVCNAIDLGDPQAPHGSVHPRNKQVVSTRLTAAALSLVYDTPTAYLNPTFVNAKPLPVVTLEGAARRAWWWSWEWGVRAFCGHVRCGRLMTVTPGVYVRTCVRLCDVMCSADGDAVLSVEVTFASPTLSGGGLALHSAACPVAEGVPLEECRWYDLQTSDGVWRNATVALTSDGTGLVLSVTVAGTAALSINATRGNFAPWPVVTVFSTAGLPALPWPATPIATAVIDDASGVPIVDNMTSFDASVWSQSSGRMHDSPGPGFEARPDHLLYTPSGCVTTLDDEPSCPTGCDGEYWTAGHLSTVQSYCFGRYTLRLRTAHSPNGGATGVKAFTCYGMYSEVCSLALVTLRSRHFFHRLARTLLSLSSSSPTHSFPPVTCANLR